jgi:hypothetical protein
MNNEMGLSATKQVWIWEQEESETENGHRFRVIKNRPPPFIPPLRNKKRVGLDENA